MKKFILTIFMLLVATVATADTMQLNWLHPTEREDDTVLLPEEIAHYQLVINNSPQPDLIDGTLQSVIFDLVNPGSYNVTVRTVDTEGRVSVDAVVTNYGVAVKDPKPATTLTLKRLK